MVAQIGSRLNKASPDPSWPETRPPIFGNSGERATVLATLALLPRAATGDVSAKVARDKGVQWLAETKTDDDPQSETPSPARWVVKLGIRLGAAIWANCVN
ncbi:MAG: hypothetical protein WD063_09925 [Pirellulales bacterium]